MTEVVSPPAPKSRVPREPPAVSRPGRGGIFERLFEPVDISSLVALRILFGAIMVWEVYRYFSHGWIERYFVRPPFHFTFFGFGWVEPWPGGWMKVHFAALGVLAACITVGFAYRIAMPLFFLGFSYVFLLEQARYLNHFYFVMLIALLLCFVPAHRAFSVDAALFPRLRSATAPTWALWLLRAQIGLVFVFAGIAKLNGDWLRGEPLRAWLADRTDFPVIGRFFTEDWAPYLFSYGGLFFDLFIVPFLLWRRTRPFAFIAAVVFHTTNAELFRIGIFPGLALATMLIFFPPEWPRQLFRPGQSPVTRAERRPLTTWRRVGIGLAAAYLAVQILVPLRHHFYPGNVAWTEEGHQFSWRMKLRDKEGDAAFIATDPRTGRSWEVDWGWYLTGWQYQDMTGSPDMILQFARHLARDLEQKGYRGVEIRARTSVSLNGRKPQELVDPNVDLARKERTIFGADWIVPLREPLR